MIDLIFMWVMIPICLALIVIGFLQYRRTGTWPQVWLTLMIVLLTVNNSLGAVAPGRYETLKVAISIVVIVIGSITLYQGFQNRRSKDPR